MTARRMHIATQWQLIGGGSVLRCKCGEWESDPAQSVRVQRAAHRAHRVQMGETVAPVKPTLAERVAAVRALHQPTEGMGYNPDDDPTPGAYGDIARVCTSCGTPGELGVRWPCPTIRALDGELGEAS